MDRPTSSVLSSSVGGKEEGWEYVHDSRQVRRRFCGEVGQVKRVRVTTTEPRPVVVGRGPDIGRTKGPEVRTDGN